MQNPPVTLVGHGSPLMTVCSSVTVFPGQGHRNRSPLPRPQVRRSGRVILKPHVSYPAGSSGLPAASRMTSRNGRYVFGSAGAAGDMAGFSSGTGADLPGDVVDFGGQGVHLVHCVGEGLADGPQAVPLGAESRDPAGPLHVQGGVADGDCG